MKDRAHEISLNSKYDGCHRELASMVYRFFDKKTGTGANANEVLAKDLHELLIKKLKRRKVYARFRDNTWSADLVEMRSLSSKN